MKGIAKILASIALLALGQTDGIADNRYEAFPTLGYWWVIMVFDDGTRTFEPEIVRVGDDDGYQVIERIGVDKFYGHQDFEKLRPIEPLRDWPDYDGKKRTAGYYWVKLESNKPEIVRLDERGKVRRMSNDGGAYFESDFAFIKKIDPIEWPKKK